MARSALDPLAYQWLEKWEEAPQRLGHREQLTRLRLFGRVLDNLLQVT